MSYSRNTLLVVTILAAISVCIALDAMSEVSGPIDAPTNYVFSLPRETGAIGTSFLEMNQKYNTVGADGDLRVSIPLFEVPGKIPVPLTLSYKSGIQLDQSASWVGLGWNLGGWSVKRVTVNGDDIQSFTYHDRDNQSRYFVHDVYQVDIPGKSLRFFNTGTIEQPHFVPMQHSLDSLYVDVDPVRHVVCDSCWVDTTYIYGFPIYYLHCEGMPSYQIGNPDIWSPQWEYTRYNYFVLVDENATRYVFKFALRRSATGGPVEDFYRTPSGQIFGGTCNVAYDESLIENGEWMLSAILSHDYVDGGGDPLDPLDCGSPNCEVDPRAYNSGAWVKFVYTGHQPGDGYNNNPENTKLARLTGKWINSPNGDGQSWTDTTEVTYLRKIVTPTVVVDFRLQSLANKFRNIRYWRSGRGDLSSPVYAGWNPGDRTVDYVLSRIRVFEYGGDSTKPVGNWIGDAERGEPIFAATFNYECPDSVLRQEYRDSAQLKKQWHNFFYDNGSGFSQQDDLPMRDGEATLRSVVIGTDNRLQGAFYEPSLYSATELAPFGYKKRYTFAYDLKLEDPNGPLSKFRWSDTSGYGFWHSFDNYGSWVLGQDLPYPHYLLSNRIWDNADLRNQGWFENTTRLIPRAWTFREFFGYHYQYPQAWSLTKMTTPEGVTYGYDYESDEFNIGTNHWVSGGCRVKNIIVNAPTDTTKNWGDTVPVHAQYPWRDVDRTDTIRLTYGNDDDGIGYATSMPDNYEIFRHEYSDSSMSPWVNHERPGLFLRFLGDNADHVIQYPRITWHLPGNNGTIEQYYLTTDTMPSHRRVTMKFRTTTNNYVVNTMGRSDISFYNAFWLDRSTLHGVNYKTIMRDANRREVSYDEKVYSWPIVTASLFPQTDGFETSRFTFQSSRFDCDTIAISYNLRLDKNIVRKDGVSTTTNFTYETGPLARLISSSQVANGKERITEYEYAATGIAGQTTVFDNRHYLSLKTEAVTREVPGDVRAQQLFTYKSDFPSQNRSGQQAVFYLHETKDSVDNFSAPNKYLVTEVLDVDRLGNPVAVRMPDGTETGGVYSHRGLEASFANVDGDNWAYFSEDETVPGFTPPNQPPRLHLHAPSSIVGPVAPTFTGARSCLIPATNATQVEGIGAFWASPPAGMYVAECWVISPGSGGTAQLYLTNQSQTVTAAMTATNQWQHLVCSLQVTQGQLLSVGTQATMDSAYVDNFRVYPVGSLASSFTYDPLLRKTTAAGPDNVPSRAFYNQYGDLSCVADYKYSPIEDREWFYKSTEPLTRPSYDLPTTQFDKGLRYRADMPNAVYTLKGRGTGICDDFSSSRLHQYQYDTTLSLANGRLWFEANNSSPFARHGDLVVPVQPFNDGIMFFDVLDSIEYTFGACDNTQSGGDELWSHLWYGCENDQGGGYGVCITDSHHFMVFRYSNQNEYENSRQYLANIELHLLGDSGLGNCGYASGNDAWGMEYSVRVSKGKQRLGVGRIGNDLYFFINNDCVYRLTDTYFGSTKFTALHLRLRRGSDEICSLRSWVDNLVFVSDPTVTADFINSFGKVKQTQTFDGSRIAITGATYTFDGQKECGFKPVWLTPSATYGCFSWINDEVNPFDFVTSYLNSESMFAWQPGTALDAGCYLTSYYQDSVVMPDVYDAGLQVPYTYAQYSDDPLRRPWVMSPPGAFRDYPITQDYRSSDTTMYGYSAPSYAADSVFDELIIDENNNVVHTYRDKLNRVIGSSRTSFASEEVDCAGSAKDTSVVINCHGEYPGYQEGVYYQSYSLTIPQHTEPSPQVAQVESKFHFDAADELCDSALYTSVYRNDTLVVHRTGAGGMCQLSDWTDYNAIDVKAGDYIILIAAYPEGYGPWGYVDLRFKFDVCDGALVPLDTADVYTTTKFYKNFFGNDTLVVQPEEQGIHRHYNNHGWLTLDSAGDYGVEEHLYDKNGNPRFTLTASDGFYNPNRFHYMKYDPHSRPVEEGVILGVLHRTQFNAFIPEYPSPSTHDTAEYRVTARYFYDQGEFGRGRLTKAVSYASGHSDSASWEEYVYDAYGRVAQKKQYICGIDTASITRDFAMTYNSIGQQLQVRYPNQKYVNYSYNRAGQVTQVADSVSSMRVQFDYWPTGQVRKKAFGSTGTAQIVDYKYNARDWLVSINDGQVTNVESGSGDHVGLELTYNSNAYAGPQSQFPAGYYNGNIASYTARVSDAAVTGGVRTTVQKFAYDPLDRMAGEDFTGNTLPSPTAQLYGYDRNGNLTNVRRASNSLLLQGYSYYPGTNQVRCIGPSLNCSTDNFLYMPSGSIYRYESEDMDMSYNYAEQLAGRVRQGQVLRDSVHYWYNTSGQRIAKKTEEVLDMQCWAEGDSTGINDDPVSGQSMRPPGGSTLDSMMRSRDALSLESEAAPRAKVAPTLNGKTPGDGGGGEGYWYPCPEKETARWGYYYLGGDMLSDYFKAGASTTLYGNYVYANGERIAKFKAGLQTDVAYYVGDHLGSVLATIGYNGNVKTHNLYRPWGEMLSSKVIGPSANNFRYTGQYLDEELGRDIAYYGQRYYDPALKIFTSPDPLWYKDPGTGSYVYCRNNPVKFVDRQGDSVTLFIDHDRAYGAGHMFGAVGNDRTGWTVLSFERKGGDGFPLYTGGDLDVQRFGEPLQDIMDAELQIQNGYVADEAKMWETSAEFDQKVMDRINQIKNGGDDPAYALFGFNCADAAIYILFGIAPTEIPGPALPNLYFKVLKGDKTLKSPTQKASGDKKPKGWNSEVKIDAYDPENGMPPLEP